MLSGRILITGGMGFIGRHVQMEFLKNDITPKIWDKKFHRVNILNPPRIHERINAIMHLAAQLEILNVNPVTELVMNVEATIKMLEICRKYDIPKFVFASTADVYGEPNSVPTYETHPIQPMWSYGSSKASCEIYVKQYEELYGIKTVIIRPSIVTGVGEWYGRFVTLNLARVRRNEPILVFGNGNQTRDFVDVEDVARLFYLATVKNIKTPEVFNAGSGKALRIKDVAKYLSKINFNRPTIKFVNPQVGELGRKPHEQVRQHLKINHAIGVLRWRPKNDIKQTLKHMNSWIVHNMSNEFFEAWSRKPRY